MGYLDYKESLEKLLEPEIEGKEAEYEPLKVYLKELSKFPLLTREGEIAKKIEEGKELMMKDMVLLGKSALIEANLCYMVDKRGDYDGTGRPSTG